MLGKNICITKYLYVKLVLHAAQEYPCKYPLSCTKCQMRETAQIGGIDRY